jgi:hypothetical protein
MTPHPWPTVIDGGGQDPGLSLATLARFQLIAILNT